MKTVRNGRWKRRILRTIILIAGIFIIACLVFDHFVQFRRSDAALEKLFEDNKIEGKISYLQTDQRRIRYIVIGRDSLPAIFFIHGSPSSLSIYEKYFTDSFFLKNFRMIAVDRPGYGGSGFGFPEPSIEKQAKMLAAVLKKERKSAKPLMIVAGSYGTSVACRMMMDQPGIADGMVLIAPSLAPGQEKVFWFTSLIEFPFIRWFIPRMFQSANTEKLHHRNELAGMLPYWDRIRVPVMYLQGANDGLIYTSNADFAKRHMVNVPYLNIELLKDRPHFFAFSDRMIIRQKIIDLYTHLNK